MKINREKLIRAAELSNQPAPPHFAWDRLPVVIVALYATGVTAWAGQFLYRALALDCRAAKWRLAMTMVTICDVG